MSFRVSTIVRPEDLASIRSEWLDLMVRSGETLPFVLPEWLSAWWRHFRKDERWLRDHLTIKVVRRASGELVGVVPLMRTERPAGGPIQLRVLGFLGADPYITEQPAPLVDATCAAEVAHAVVRELEEQRDWDWIHWRGLRRGSAFADAIEHRMELSWQGSQPANLLQVGTSWAAFKGGLRRNIKESLRHCYNSLKRDDLSFRFLVTTAPDEVPRALDRFFELHRARSLLTGTVPHPDRFASKASRRFLKDTCQHLAERGALRIFTLEIGGEAAAARVAFVLPGTLYLYYSGFDPKWMKYSVATTVVAESIQYAIAERLPVVHLSMGEDVSKSRWRPEMPLYSDAIAFRRGVTSHAKWKAYELVSQAREIPLVQRFIPTRGA